MVMVATMVRGSIRQRSRYKGVCVLGGALGQRLHLWLSHESCWGRSFHPGLKAFVIFWSSLISAQQMPTQVQNGRYARPQSAITAAAGCGGRAQRSGATLSRAGMQQIRENVSKMLLTWGVLLFQKHLSLFMIIFPKWGERTLFRTQHLWDILMALFSGRGSVRCRIHGQWLRMFFSFGEQSLSSRPLIHMVINYSELLLHYIKQKHTSAFVSWR